MLSSLEMVSEPSGKTKTLIDLIKEGSIITPETPVYTSDDSMELKDFIESMIPAVSIDWKSETKENIVYNTLIDLPTELSNALDQQEDAFTDVRIILEDTTAKSTTVIEDTFAHFKSFFKTKNNRYPIYTILANNNSIVGRLNVEGKNATTGIYQYMLLLSYNETWNITFCYR